MSDKSPTPDLLPRFQRKSRFDSKPTGAGRNDHDIVCGATNIKRSPAGRADPMDKATGRGTNAQSSLGNGGGRLNDAVKLNSHCGVAPKADFGFLRKG